MMAPTRACRRMLSIRRSSVPGCRCSPTSRQRIQSNVRPRSNRSESCSSCTRPSVISVTSGMPSKAKASTTPVSFSHSEYFPPKAPNSPRVCPTVRTFRIRYRSRALSRNQVPWNSWRARMIPGYSPSKAAARFSGSWPSAYVVRGAPYESPTQSSRGPYQSPSSRPIFCRSAALTRLRWTRTVAPVAQQSISASACKPRLDQRESVQRLVATTSQKTTSCMRRHFCQVTIWLRISCFSVKPYWLERHRRRAGLEG
mmetsp:Transcript_65072/g.190885  ORF Transcript_65072/g.190885 Transcript_65072/m.190885 type:complete len:256 (-) Transcript_65072:673-1440(-)